MHPIGSPAVLLGLDIATGDRVALAAAYAAELDLEFRVVGDVAVANVGPHVLRLVPAGGQVASAAVVIGAGIAEHRSVEALGVRFQFQAVSLAVAPG